MVEIAWNYSPGIGNLFVVLTSCTAQGLQFESGAWPLLPRGAVSGRSLESVGWKLPAASARFLRPGALRLLVSQWLLVLCLPLTFPYQAAHEARKPRPAVTARCQAQGPGFIFIKRLASGLGEGVSAHL